MHLLGDVHQPLHVGSAYVSDKNTFVVPASAAAVDNVLIFSTAGDNDLIFESVLYFLEYLKFHGCYDILPNRV